MIIITQSEETLINFDKVVAINIDNATLYDKDKSFKDGYKLSVDCEHKSCYPLGKYQSKERCEALIKELSKAIIVGDELFIMPKE